MTFTKNSKGGEGYGVLKVVQKFFPEVNSVVDAARPQHIEVLKKDTQSKPSKTTKNVLWRLPVNAN